MKVKSIAKNTSFFTLALILQKVISFSYFAILARNLVPEELGKYYLAISFTTIFAIIIDLGLANVLTREVAKKISGEDSDDVDGAKRLYKTVLALKLPLALISLASVVIIANVLPYSPFLKLLIYVSSIAMVMDSFTLNNWSYIRGNHVLKYESLGVIIYQLLVFAFGISLLKMGKGLEFLMGVMALASVANFLFSTLVLYFKFKLTLIPSLDKILAKKIIALSIPFALFAVLQRLYMYLDSVLLSAMAGDAQVGLYQIAFKIVFALQFLPMAFMASLYPAFALYYKENKEQLSVSFERALKYLLIISLPVSLGIIFLSEKILLIFKPEYAEAVWPLRLVMMALPFIFINFPIGAMLNACNRQKVNTRNMALILVGSILINLVLIPKYMALGASITVLLSNAFMTVLGIIQIKKIFKIRYKQIFQVLFKITISVSAMSLVVVFLRERINIFINIAISAIIYVGALFAVKGFSREDINSIIKSLKRS